MSRIINPDGVGKERKRLSRDIVVALRVLMQTNGTGPESRDMVAFISQSLLDLFKTVDVSISAWEKRGYWIKADRFRMEWTWSERCGEKLRDALVNDDWALVSETILQVAMKLNTVHIPTRYHIEHPWDGACALLLKDNKMEKNQ